MCSYSRHHFMPIDHKHLDGLHPQEYLVRDISRSVSHHHAIYLELQYYWKTSISTNTILPCTVSLQMGSTLIHCKINHNTTLTSYTSLPCTSRWCPSNICWSWGLSQLENFMALDYEGNVCLGSPRPPF